MEISTGIGTRPPTSGTIDLIVIQTRIPTRALLIRILAPSHTACGPKIRLMPLIGLSWDNFGFMRLVAR